MILCFIFIPQVYSFKYFKTKTKQMQETEAKSRFILSNNSNNKLSEGTPWSVEIVLRKDINR